MAPVVETCMATVLRVVGYLSIPVLLISVGLTVRSIRREQAVAVTVRSAVFPVLVVGVMVWVYVSLLGVTATATRTWLPFAAGIAGGAWWNTRSTRLAVRGGMVVGAKTAWVLVPWGLAMALTQGLALTGSDLTVPMGYTILFAASGLTIGENMRVLWRRSQLLGATPHAGPAVAVLLLLFLIVGLPATAMAADYSFRAIAAGEVPGLSVHVTGSGRGYYGDSISATFRNDTSHTVTVEVETGLQLVPRDESVQTMITVGQVVSIPPGETAVLLEAFCGEMHDRGPGAADEFDVGDRIDDEDLLRVLHEVRRSGQGDSYDAQQLVWNFRDGNDVSDNEAAQQILRDSRTRPTRDDAEKAAGAVAALNGAVAIGLTRTGDRRLLTGSGAVSHLRSSGAEARVIAVTGDDGVTRESTYVLPPRDRPEDAAAIAFTTREVVDARTGETVTVIDEREEVQVLLKPLIPPPLEDAPPPPPPTDAPSDPATTPGGTRITDDEVKRIVDWGVEHNRHPDDIARDVEARNETLGGSGSVALGDQPRRVTLPQGEVTLTAAEHAEYLRRAEAMADRLDNARIVRGTFESLQRRMRFWSAVDRAVVARWIMGTKQIYDQALLINDPGPWMARSSGFGTVDEMLEVGYGRPTWTTYDSRRFGSLDEAIAAWKRTTGGGWEQYQVDRARHMQAAREKLRRMLPRTRQVPLEGPSGFRDAAGRWLPARTLVGPNVDVPVELLPTTGAARNDMSWYNRPAHELSRLLKAQQQGQEYLKQTNEELRRFLEYERELAARIGTLNDP